MQSILNRLCSGSFTHEPYWNAWLLIFILEITLTKTRFKEIEIFTFTVLNTTIYIRPFQFFHLGNCIRALMVFHVSVRIPTLISQLFHLVIKLKSQFLFRNRLQLMLENSRRWRYNGSDQNMQKCFAASSFDFSFYLCQDCKLNSSLLKVEVKVNSPSPK